MSDHRIAKVAPPGGGKWVSWMGRPIRHLVTGADTDETCALTWGLSPAGTDAPPYRHAFADGFYVLEGGLAFYAGGSRVVAGPRTFINVPPGVVHAFKNETDRPAHQLILVPPPPETGARKGLRQI